MGRFDAEFFKGNREQLQRLFTGKAPIVLTANGLLQSSADLTFPFRQDSNFWYLTGLDEPDVVLVMEWSKEYLILPNRADWRDKFDGKVEVDRLSTLSGIKTIYDHKTGWKMLSNRLRKAKHVATLAPPPEYIDSHGFYTNPSKAHLVKMMKEYNQKLELLDLKQHLTTMRTRKQDVEIEAIRSAIDITTKTLQRITSKNWHSFKSEADIAAAISQSFHTQGASGQAFDSIVAIGSNACVIHHLPDNQPIKGGGVVLFDIGAQVDHYAADVSRTFYLGKPTRRANRIYQAVLEVKDYALGLLKPGVVIKNYEIEVEKFMGEKLRELGLIKSIDHDSVRKYFPHATTHHLGLDAHDLADYQQPLPPNSVVTVEPGIYIPKEGIAIRIEEDVLITDTGNLVLSAGLSRSLKSLTIKEV